jgi:4-hydroxy-tetrahydrodipicolinate synthase
MAYNNPANSAAPELTGHDLATLYRDGSIGAVKSTFPAVHQVHDVRDRTDDGLRVFYGSFMAPLEALAGGAHGWISGILNVMTTEAVDLWEAMNVGDLDHARAVWSRILRIRRIYTDQQLGPVSDLAIYRGILKLRGRTAGFCCAPLTNLDRDQFDALERLLESIDSHETAVTRAER